MKTIQRIRKRDKGASLIEFAILMPFLLLLVLGIIEFGFFMGERNELKHGAHEGARLAAVNDSNLLVNTCNSLDLNSTITVTFTDGATGAIGEQGSIVLTTPVSSLSGLGFIDSFLPATMTADASFKLEQASTNWSAASGGSCP
jgi:TadE-like protein